MTTKLPWNLLNGSWTRHSTVEAPSSQLYLLRKEGIWMQGLRKKHAKTNRRRTTLLCVSKMQAKCVLAILLNDDRITAMSKTTFLLTRICHQAKSCYLCTIYYGKMHTGSTWNLLCQTKHCMLPRSSWAPWKNYSSVVRQNRINHLCCLGIERYIS